MMFFDAKGGKRLDKHGKISLKAIFFAPPGILMSNYDDFLMQKVGKD